MEEALLSTERGGGRSPYRELLAGRKEGRCVDTHSVGGFGEGAVKVQRKAIISDQ
jgi:hypothetical protein